MTGIEALEEILRLLRITEEYILDENKTTKPETLKEMLAVSAIEIV